jgi:hypothetical protein
MPKIRHPPVDGGIINEVISSFGKHGVKSRVTFVYNRRTALRQFERCVRGETFDEVVELPAIAATVITRYEFANTFANNEL